MIGRKSAIVGLLCAWMLTAPLSASSFALRGLDKGGQVPDIEFVGISGGGGKLSSFAGEKGLVVIYWATWSSRSPAILRFAEKELRRYEKAGLKILAVNADHQEMSAEDLAAVKAMAVETGVTFPVVLDAGLKGYNEIGIISTPTTLVIDKDLKVIEAYPGFPSTARDDIPDRIDAFLGIVKEKREEKAQYFLDHRPKNYALQYYNLGKQLFLSARTAGGDLRSVPEDAIERLDEAIRRDPDFFRPYLLKAIILDLAGANGRREAALQELKKRDFQEVYERRALGLGYLYMGMDALAADFFQLVASQTPGDAAVLFGQAVLAARGKNGPGAKKAIEGISKDPKSAEALRFDPGRIFDASGELRPGTEKTLRSALDRLLEIEKQSNGSLRPDAPVRIAPAEPSPQPAAPAATPPPPVVPPPVVPPPVVPPPVVPPPAVPPPAVPPPGVPPPPVSGAPAAAGTQSRPPQGVPAPPVMLPVR